jgi:hypothetical protein
MTDIVKIIKPHGCVHALEEAREAQRAGDAVRARERADRFLITKRELDAILPDPSNPTQQFLFDSLCTAISSRPLAVVGWSMSEEYLLAYMEAHVRPILTGQTLAKDALSIIDIRFNDDGHRRVAACFGRTRVTAHFDVASPALDTDGLFLWLQALYGLERLIVSAMAADRAALEPMLSASLQTPGGSSPLAQWIDNFLPTWVRLCWRWGAVRCVDSVGQTIRPDEFGMEKPDEHVPWNIANILRPEMRAAAHLLAALLRTGRMTAWDFDTFRGGLYRPGDGWLVIPLPTWSGEDSNDFRALKPLVNDITHGVAAPVQRLSILLLTAADTDDVTPAVEFSMRQRLAQQFPIARFADPANIDSVSLASL